MRWRGGAHGQPPGRSARPRPATALAWARRPQAAAVAAAPADPDRGGRRSWSGEYGRAFNGWQYAVMKPLFQQCGIQLWDPEVGADRLRH